MSLKAQHIHWMGYSRSRSIRQEQGTTTTVGTGSSNWTEGCMKTLIFCCDMQIIEQLEFFLPCEMQCVQYLILVEEVGTMYLAFITFSLKMTTFPIMTNEKDKISLAQWLTVSYSVP